MKYLEDEYQYFFIPASVSQLYKLFLFFQKKQTWELYAIYIGQKRQVKIHLQDLSQINDAALQTFLLRHATVIQAFMDGTLPFDRVLTYLNSRNI